MNGRHGMGERGLDRYLASHTPNELNTGNTLFDLYKAWRDECKVGFKRVHLDKLIQWLEEHKEA